MFIWPLYPRHFPCGTSRDMGPRIRGCSVCTWGLGASSHILHVWACVWLCDEGGERAEGMRTSAQAWRLYVWVGRVGQGPWHHLCGFLPVLLPGTMCLDAPKVNRGDLLLDLSVYWRFDWIVFPHEFTQLSGPPPPRAGGSVWEETPHSGKAPSVGPHFLFWVPWRPLYVNHPAPLHLFYPDLSSISSFCLRLCVYGLGAAGWKAMDQTDSSGPPAATPHLLVLIFPSPWLPSLLSTPGWCWWGDWEQYHPTSVIHPGHSCPAFRFPLAPWVFELTLKMTLPLSSRHPFTHRNLCSRLIPRRWRRHESLSILSPDPKGVLQRGIRATSWEGLCLSTLSYLGIQSAAVLEDSLCVPDGLVKIWHYQFVLCFPFSVFS